MFRAFFDKRYWPIGVCWVAILLSSAELISVKHHAKPTKDIVIRLPGLPRNGRLPDGFQMGCARTDGARWAAREDNTCHSVDAPPMRKDVGL